MGCLSPSSSWRHKFRTIGIPSVVLGTFTFPSSVNPLPPEKKEEEKIRRRIKIEMLDMFFITIPVQASPTLQQLFGGLSKWPDLLYTCNFVFVPINDNNTHHHDHLNHDDNICLSPSAPPCPPRTATSLLNMDHCFEDRQAFISIINIIIGILIKHNHHQGEGACYIKSPNTKFPS